MKKTTIVITACLLCASLVFPLSSRASSLGLKDFTDKLSVSGDLRVRYENIEKDLPGENTTDRARQRFRLGVKFDTTENFAIAAGLATGGEDATSTNDTYSDDSFFDTGDIRLDYAYAEHTVNDMIKIIAGQQKNPFQTSWALWDSDVRPAGFTAMIDLAPVFVTTGWYDVYYADADMSQMEAIQVGAKTDVLTGTLSFYNFHGDSASFFDEVVGGPSDYMDDDYKYQIVDLYCAATIKKGRLKLTPQAQVFMNIGAKGNKGQGVMAADIDPEEENLGYMVGVKAGFDKLSGGIAYASIGADACIPQLKDSDFGGSLGSVDVEGFKIGCGYKVTSHCSVNLTALLYEAKERKNDQDARTYQLDLQYKF